jgi:uncharacterized protein (TIGR03067 family)
VQTALTRDEALVEGMETLDHGRLQGTWEFFAGPREAHLVIAGDHFTVRFRNGDVYVGTFSLGPSERPKTMDMHIAEGPDRHKGLKSLAIYALDGDRLIWSTARPGASERPRHFPAPEDREPLFIVFQRQKENRDGVGKRLVNKPR